jgi:FAD:protein FMN transferase
VCVAFPNGSFLESPSQASFCSLTHRRSHSREIGFTSPESGECLYLTISRRAMATDFELLLHRDLDSSKVDAAVQALETVEAIEAELTVYQSSSAIARVNANAGQKATRVSTSVFDVLAKSVAVSDRLAGAFDITSGPLIEAWGFTKRSGRRPTDPQLRDALQFVGWQRLRLDPETRDVYLPEGMSINLGAIGKGHALDRIAAQLRLAGIDDFLLHGGNSSLLARGHADRNASAGWLVGLSHPTRTNVRLGGIRLRDQALATSGSGKQFFHYQGQRYGHVIDPRTGWPAGDCHSLTVLANDAALADAMATGLFVLGSAAATEFVNQNEDIQVLMVLPAVRQGEIEIRSCNMAADTFSFSE